MVSLQYIVVIIIHSKRCYINLPFLQPPAGSQHKQMKWAKNDHGHQTPSGIGKAEGDWLFYAIHDCKSWAGRLPLLYQDKQNMPLRCACDLPQCLELCRWQPGQGNRASSAHMRIGFQCAIVTDGIVFKAICVLEHLKCFLPEATCQ